MDPTRSIIALAFAAAAFTAAAAEQDSTCLACHGQAGPTKTLSGGDKLELHVDGKVFGTTVHEPMGCTGCHSAIDLAKHPGTPRKLPASAREYSLAATESCKTCHQPIFDAYLTSTHGKARAQGAPLCSDCHNPHAVTRSALAVPKDTCVGCHSTAVEAHQKWLPNAAHHFEVVACAACHSPNAQRKVDLRLFDASGKEVAAGAPTPPSQEPLNETRLAQFVHLAGRDGKVTLVGRLEVPDGAEKHALQPGAKAIKECTTCHRKDAPAFQNVTLSVISADGARVRYEARKEVLHAPTSVESVRGFYALGGTRIEILDVLLALALIGGISGPIVHLVMRKLSRKKDQPHA